MHSCKDSTLLAWHCWYFICINIYNLRYHIGIESFLYFMKYSIPMCATHYAFSRTVMVTKLIWWKKTLLKLRCCDSIKKSWIKRYARKTHVSCIIFFLPKKLVDFFFFSFLLLCTNSAQLVWLPEEKMEKLSLTSHFRNGLHVLLLAKVKLL